MFVCTMTFHGMVSLESICAANSVACVRTQDGLVTAARKYALDYTPLSRNLTLSCLYPLCRHSTQGNAIMHG